MSTTQEKIKRILTKNYPDVKIQKTGLDALAKLLGNFRAHFRGSQTSKEIIRDLDFINPQSAKIREKIIKLVKENSDKDARYIIALLTTTVLHNLLDMIVFYMEDSDHTTTMAAKPTITPKIIKEVFEVDSVFTNLFGDIGAHREVYGKTHLSVKKSTKGGKLTVAELRKMASDKNIAGRSKMNKAELVKALKL